jgi:hypothetical protein
MMYATSPIFSNISKGPQYHLVNFGKQPILIELISAFTLRKYMFFHFKIWRRPPFPPKVFSTSRSWIVKIQSQSDSLGPRGYPKPLYPHAQVSFASDHGYDRGSIPSQLRLQRYFNLFLIFFLKHSSLSF